MNLIAIYAAIAFALMGAGAAINGWRMSAGHQAELAELKERSAARYEALNDAVRAQNKAMQDSKAETAIAQAVAKEAQRALELQKPVIESRIEKITKYVPKDCDDAVKHWWEAR